MAGSADCGDIFSATLDLLNVTHLDKGLHSGNIHFTLLNVDLVFSLRNVGQGLGKEIQFFPHDIVGSGFSSEIYFVSTCISCDPVPVPCVVRGLRFAGVEVDQGRTDHS